MAKIVARMMKLKAENLKGIEIHNQRETENHSNKDIDVERSHLNYDLVNPQPINYKKQVSEFIKKKRTSKRAVRKDAVLVDEWILTSSPDFFETLDDLRPFFETCLAYFEERCGKETIQYAVVHLDESTPHMHLGIVPMTNGRLNHKMMFDRQALIAIQDELPQFLQDHGFSIERGLKGSERKHLTVPEYKEMQEELQSFEQAITQSDKLLAEKNKEFNEIFTNVRELETKQEEIIQSLEKTIVPDLENLKEKKFSLSGLKYVLSDSDLKTIKSIANDLKTLRTQNKHLKTQNRLLETQKKELEQQNQEKNNKLNTLAEELDKTNVQLADFEERQSAFEQSDQLKQELQTKTERLTELENENRVLKSELSAIKGFFADLNTKYQDLKLKFDGLTTYLHEVGGDTKEIILVKIKQGIEHMRNAPKIKSFLEQYSATKTYYVADNGSLFSPEKDSSKGVTMYLKPKFTPLKDPSFNKETGYYEFVGEYMANGYPRKNTLYLSEQDILANKPFSFKQSTDYSVWATKNQRSTGYSQDKGWSR